MPNRSDKRDAIALSAYLSGLEVEFIDGVDATLMPEKAYPQVLFPLVESISTDLS